MKLELKSIQYNAALSDETNAYSAKLYKDGKHVADVANRGHGGCDEQHWRDHTARRDIEAYFATFPRQETGYSLKGEPVTYQPDLESWSNEQVDRFALLKTLKAACRKKVVGIIGPDQVTFKFDPDKLDVQYAHGETARQLFIKRNPGLVILNGLSDDQLVEVYRGQSNIVLSD
ncbi:hypothetical protein [Phyllobacterium sp. P30BS-XVII]|uniref:hypothetical protein n=1 Tax=Phyllobacterium sp. P30BS-XVII TaxID=2587046 RepID=UPI0015F91A85|nr:hypothetical protein [Phyllobacterium sp. P30BS-XVII]MBA8904117.1 hypothetical protein [Phyllobacterium sp. P30BS-XVII]